MRKIRDVLRYRHSAGLSLDATAQALNISKSVAAKYIRLIRPLYKFIEQTHDGFEIGHPLKAKYSLQHGVMPSDFPVRCHQSENFVMNDGHPESGRFHWRGSELNMTRDEMIDALESDTRARMVIKGHGLVLQDILEKWFAGCANWSDEDLRCELRRRGIDPAKSANEEDDEEPVEDGDRDSYDREDDEEFLRLAGHLGSSGQTQYLLD